MGKQQPWSRLLGEKALSGFSLHERRRVVSGHPAPGSILAPAARDSNEVERCSTTIGDNRLRNED